MVFTEKTISGTFYGSVRPNVDFPVLVDHYMNKRLNIDGLISRTYKLDEINEGFRAMMGGEVARGVVVFD
jgi:S-(hydroxymethyl)glutathione dehydrogenase/alcohol dehydrogenase